MPATTRKARNPTTDSKPLRCQVRRSMFPPAAKKKAFWYVLHQKAFIKGKQPLSRLIFNLDGLESNYLVGLNPPGQVASINDQGRMPDNFPRVKAGVIGYHDHHIGGG